MKLQDAIFAYVDMGPKKKRWTFADVSNPSQPLAGVACVPEDLRRSLETLRDFGFMHRAAHGFGCTSFWKIAHCPDPYFNRGLSSLPIETGERP